MQTKDITFTLKKGLPNFSSVSAGLTITLEEGETPQDAFGEARRIVISECNVDESWLREDDKEKEQKRATQQYLKKIRI